MRDQLFPFIGPSEWLLDETLYSLCSRLHRLSGACRSADTCRILFDNARQGTAHDLPSRLDTFVERTRGWFGTADELIDQRTLWPFYTPFQSAEMTSEARAAMRGLSIGSLKTRLGLPAGRFRAHHPLKVCHQCLSRDRETYGVAYWHRSHQWPGVWLCAEHGDMLFIANIRWNGRRRFEFDLPENVTLSCPVSADVLDAELRDRLRRFASLVHGLISLSKDFHFSAIRLGQTYQVALSQAGMRRGNEQVAWQILKPELCQFLAPLRKLPEFAALASTHAQVPGQFGPLFRRARSGVHPLRHLVFISYLFRDWHSFFAAYRATGEPVAATARETKVYETPRYYSVRNNVSYRAWLVARVDRDGWSVSAASSTLGIDIQTALEWLAQESVQIKRRPKRIDARRRARVVTGLRHGVSKDEIATREDISEVSVARILRSEPGLQQVWLDKRLSDKREHMREQWNALLTTAPELGVKSCRSLKPSIYAWLYRHDRLWLAACNKQADVIRRGGAPVDWHKRDMELAHAVEQAAEYLCEQQNLTSVRLWQLVENVPELGPRLRLLDRLPRTRRILDRLAVARRSAKRSRLL